jgi:4-hydroxybenzoate polyprenyltransferase
MVQSLSQVAKSAEASRLPLVVDLDGTLIRSDLLIEATFAYLGRNPFAIGHLCFVLLKGKSQLKEFLATRVALDASILPYNEEVLERIREAVESGRPVYLASASNRRFAASVAEHLGLFQGCFASDEYVNLSGAAKASRLLQTFGERGFDYIGNERADLPAWAIAAHCICVNASPRLRSKLLKLAPQAEMLASPKLSLKTWAKLLRVHQYVKNLLVFVPVVTAHNFDPTAILRSALAMVAFCLCSSSVYILNDLVDLAADRQHPTKRTRPFASGSVPLEYGILAIPLLLVLSFAVAVQVSMPFAGVLLGYLALTTAYTFSLKRKMVIDVVSLGILYTIRVIAGTVVTNTPISEWLFGFSIFMFTALALIKRYTELATRLDADLPDITNRNYKIGDLNIVAALASASGFNAVTIFSLYISSDTVRSLYRHPQVLWLICPILMYWFGRMLLLAHRRLIDDDPIVFALKDRVSLMVLVAIGIAIIGAT